MSDPWYHCYSSARAFGGKPDDYLVIHQWLDRGKNHFSDFRHRALSHHSEGVWECQQVFGSIITLSTNVRVPVKLIAEQHILEDLNGQIPSVKDWLSLIQPQRWMSPPAKLLFGKANRNYPDIPND